MTIELFCHALMVFLAVLVASVLLPKGYSVIFP